METFTLASPDPLASLAVPQNPAEAQPAAHVASSYLPPDAGKTMEIPGTPAMVLFALSVPSQLPSTGETVYCQVPPGTECSVQLSVAVDPEMVPEHAAPGVIGRASCRERV